MRAADTAGFSQMRTTAGSSTPGVDRLTPRQMQILLGLCRGLCRKQISQELGICQQTFSVHQQRLLERIGCKNVAQLGVWAERHGLLGGVHVGH